MKKDKKNKCIALTMKHSPQFKSNEVFEIIEFEWGVF